MLRFTRGRGRKPDPKDKIAQELLSFAKTIEHGFPHKPSAVAFDKEIGLLAIGTSTGFLKIYGKPGVELSAYHTTKTRIQELHFLPKQGRVISVCDDVTHDSIHLWEINKKDGKSILEEVKTCTLQGRLKKIAVCSLSMRTNRLYLGTEGGNIYLLDINSFDLLDHIIYQDVVIQGVPEEYRTVNPGSVEAIQENPQNKEQVLIGYKKGLMVLWDHQSCDLKQSFCSMQGLESLHFDHSGEKFVSSHADGSLTVWNLREDAENKCESPCESPCPFGPFPCKAITKVCWFEPYTIFSGGMPRASYGDRHCISVICGDSTQATFDFTSRVVDFFIIFKKRDKNKPSYLAVLCEHEFVVIDLLKENGYSTFASPYLSCLHSSPITCSQHVHNCPDDLWNLLKEAGADQLGSSYPQEDWPITGGRSLLPRNSQHDVLLTGHEDGSVRFWDVSSLNMSPLYTIQTSRFFSGDHEPPDQTDGEDEGWPHLRKVGLYDPYCDDQRLGVQKIYFDAEEKILAVGGHGGQVIVLDVNNEERNVEIQLIDINLVKEFENFNWKGLGPLTPKSEAIKVSKGFKPTMIVQITPASCVTAVALKTKWGLLAAGSTHGFFLLDYVQKVPILHRCTLSPDDMGSEGGTLVRRRTLKESLRRSFRRLRSGRRSGRRRQSSRSGKDPRQQSPSGEEAPVQRLIDESIKVGEGYQGLVRCLYMVDTFLKDGVHHGPSLWVGTNSGYIYPYTIELPPEDQRRTNSVLAHPKKPEIHLKHNAPVITMFVVDKDGNPIGEDHLVESAADMSGNHSMIICSEEQFKVLSLPQLRIKHKEKLTAIDGSKVRKLGVISLRNQQGETDETYHCLGCLSNQGDLNVFALPSLRPQLKVNCIKREDLLGIQSLLFTRLGQGFYLRSPSELQRFTLTSSQELRPECVLNFSRGAQDTDEEKTAERDERLADGEDNANIGSGNARGSSEDITGQQTTVVKYDNSVTERDGNVVRTEPIVAKSARHSSSRSQKSTTTTTTVVKTTQSKVLTNGDHAEENRHGRKSSSASSSDGEGTTFKAPGKAHKKEGHMGGEFEINARY
ncbi:lethal(2) giant larvae protein homolog 2-like [Dendronephthya gigantea]|uniref:lethal(2) giant larvae protein homolog 2-like n=1 Tax=Dendronephthya gigantea TaxID=151771 RepID=UPI00106A1CB2|nr:lethal(2) giant larvae protein homolog 2-like [Dendronephthya gigantea]